MPLLAIPVLLQLAADPRCGASADIEPARIVAIAERESGFDPFIIGVNEDKSRKQPAVIVRSASAQEAADKAAVLIAQGRSVDLGLTGINARNLALDGLTLQTAFDACASIAASYRHLRRDFQAAAWELAHRRYNCGRFTCGAAYAASVEATVARVKQQVPTEVTQVPVQAVPLARPPTSPSRPAAWDVYARPIPLTRLTER